MLFECAGAADGGVQHCCAGLEAELLRHVRAGAEQCHHERLPTQGEDTHTFIKSGAGVTLSA